MVVKDPVCDMDVETETATMKSEYKGQTYYFCSPGCKREFDQNPAKFIDVSRKEGPMPPMTAGSGGNP